MWQPLGYVRSPPSNVPVSNSPGSMPLGSRAGTTAARATSTRTLDEAGLRRLDRVGGAGAGALAALARGFAACREAAAVDMADAILEILGEIAAVVGVDQRRPVRHGGGRNGVAAAQLGTVEVQL